MKNILKLTPLALALALTGCGTIGNQIREFDDPVVSKVELKKQEALKPPATGPITVAVYNFRDMTGQRKASQTIAQLSSAVTQGADAYLVKSLQEVGGGRWFKVLERGGLDNLVKERQLIRQMRELYQGKDAQPLPPMMFAGMILEGGIVGYDSNTMSGGSGARLLGIGASTEYRQDEVTISLRAVSVATGEVLSAVTVSKTVLSFQDKLGVLKFYDAGTKSFEAETGSATNESMNKAVQLAIYASVVELVKEGERKGHWAYKADERTVTAPKAQPTEAPKPVVKQEEKKDELVQKDSPQARTTEAEAKTLQPDSRATVEGTKEQTRTTETTTEVKKSDVQEAPKPVEQVKKGTIVDWVNMRQSTDYNSEKIENLKPNTLVEIVGQTNGHYKIKANGKEGWITKRFLKVQ